MKKIKNSDSELEVESCSDDAEDDPDDKQSHKKSKNSKIKYKLGKSIKTVNF